MIRYSKPLTKETAHMDFLELAAKRYSVRKFKEEKVRREDLDKILKAGMLAPTAHNDQPQRILVINSDEAPETLKKCTEITLEDCRRFSLIKRIIGKTLRIIAPLM